MADTFIQFYDNNGVPVRIRAIDNLDAEHTHSLAVEAIAPMQAIVTQPNPDLLLVNANMQVGNVDVSDANPVPVDSLAENFVLLASAARGATAGTNGTPVDIPTRIAFAILLSFTNKADDVDDTCNVYIDMLVGATWVNAIHFTQVLGNAADASAEYALLMPSADVVTLDVSTNAGSGVVRPHVIGSQMRARWIIIDPTGADASFTFSVTVYAI